MSKLKGSSKVAPAEVVDQKVGHRRRSSISILKSGNISNIEVKNASKRFAGKHFRILFAQQAGSALATIAVFSYLYNYSLSDPGWSIVTSLSGFFCLPVYFLIAWNNFDWTIFRRLCRELSTFLSVFFAALNWLVDVITPTDEFSPFLGFVVFYLTCVVVTMDCVRVIKRSTVLFLFGLFSFLMLSNFVANLGVAESADRKIFTFAEHTQYKSRTKRSLFSQIFTLTLAGLWQAIKDWKEDSSSWLHYAVRKVSNCSKGENTMPPENNTEKYPHGPYLLHMLEPIKKGRVAGTRVRITYRSEEEHQINGVLTQNMKIGSDMATVKLDEPLKHFTGCSNMLTALTEIVFEKVGDITNLESGQLEVRKRKEHAVLNEQEVLHIENFRLANEKENYMFIIRRKRGIKQARILFVTSGKNKLTELKHLIDENKDKHSNAQVSNKIRLPPDTRILPLFKPGKGVIQISHGWLWNKKTYSADLAADGSIRFNETAIAKEADKLWDKVWNHGLQDDKANLRNLMDHAKFPLDSTLGDEVQKVTKEVWKQWYLQQRAIFYLPQAFAEYTYEYHHMHSGKGVEDTFSTERASQQPNRMHRCSGLSSTASDIDDEDQGPPSKTTTQSSSGGLSDEETPLTKGATPPPKAATPLPPVDAHDHVVYVEENVARGRCFRRARKLGDYRQRTVPNPLQITLGTEATAFCGSIAACLYVINSIVFKDRSEILSQITQLCGLSCIFIFYMTNIIICWNGTWICCRQPNIDYTKPSYTYSVSNIVRKRMKLLLRESRVVIVMLCALLNWIIDILRPATKFSPINGFVFMFIVSMFILFDAFKYKSNRTVMVVGMIFLAVVLNNLAGNVFAGDGDGVVVFYYNGQPLYKRALKYDIYQQIFVLGQSGVYNAFLNLRHDRCDSLFMTETVQKYTEQRLHVINIKRSLDGKVNRAKKNLHNELEVTQSIRQQ